MGTVGKCASNDPWKRFMGYSTQIHLRQGVADMTDFFEKTRAYYSDAVQAPTVTKTGTPKKVVSIATLHVTTRRTNAQIKRALSEGRFAELRPPQAGI